MPIYTYSGVHTNVNQKDTGQLRFLSASLDTGERDGAWGFKRDIGNSQAAENKFLPGNPGIMEQRGESSRTGFCTDPSCEPYLIQISLR